MKELDEGWKKQIEQSIYQMAVQLQDLRQEINEKKNGGITNGNNMGRRKLQKEEKWRF
jgi:predicted phage tail protein